jgi:hypothetical protein
MQGIFGYTRVHTRRASHQPLDCVTTISARRLQMANFSKVVIYKAPRVDPARAAKAARVIRSIRGRYRAQAFLFLAYHFFLSSPLHLDVFVIFFILVSNFMNRNEAFPVQMFVDGVRFLLDERRFIMR